MQSEKSILRTIQVRFYKMLRNLVVCLYKNDKMVVL